MVTCCWFRTKYIVIHRQMFARLWLIYYIHIRIQLDELAQSTDTFICSVIAALVWQLTETFLTDISVNCWLYMPIADWSVPYIQLKDDLSSSQYTLSVLSEGQIKQYFHLPGNRVISYWHRITEYEVTHMRLLALGFRCAIGVDDTRITIVLNSFERLYYWVIIWL